MKTNYRNLPEKFKDLKFYASLSLAGIAIFTASLFVFLPETETHRSLATKNKAESTISTMPLVPKCEAVDWAVWRSFENKVASGTIINQGKSVGVTMTSDDNFRSTPQIEHYLAFKRFEHVAPNGLVPRTTWSKQAGGVTTICFSEAVKDPVMLLASLGSVNVLVKTTLNFSEAYVMLYNVAGMRLDNNKTITGKEGYAILKFPGEVKCIVIKSTTNDDFTDITFGISACIELVKTPESVVIAAVPEPAPKPVVETPKPAPVVAAVVKPAPAPVIVAVVKSEPAPKPIVETPKSAPVVAAVVKPEPAPKPVVEVPKPTPVVAAVVKPEPAPKPIVETPKPTPVVVAVVKPEPAPKPVVEVPKPAPVVAAVVKPEPAPKPVVETPKPAPIIVAVVKPEPAPKPVVETPKPTPVVAAVKKPEPAPKPVIEAPKPVAVVAVVLPKPASVVKPKVIPAVIVSTKPAKTVVVSPNPNTPIRSKIVKIEVWDYSGLDHDSISLKLNGKQIGPKSIELPAYNRYGSPKFTFQMELGDGENTLEIFGVSAGFEGTATVGMLLIYDDRRKKNSVSIKAKETAYIPL